MIMDEPVHWQLPGFDFEQGFTARQIQELCSVFKSNNVHINSPSGSDSSRSIYSAEERKIRRMISNRESARRSRWRKKRHLENLNHQVNRLKVENRKLKNRLCLAMQQYHVVQKDTYRLMSESMQLQQKLASLHQILDVMQQLQSSSLILNQLPN